MKFFNLFKIIIAFAESVISIFKKDKAPVIDENIEADADRILKEIEAGEHVAPVEPDLTFAETRHFKQSEFLKGKTELPQEYVKNLQTLMDQLEIIRVHFGNKPIIPTSGFRTYEQNSAIPDSADNSYHMQGRAVDFVIVGIPPSIVYEGVNQLMTSGYIIDGGLGKYNSHTHYDTGTKRRWDETK